MASGKLINAYYAEAYKIQLRAKVYTPLGFRMGGKNLMRIEFQNVHYEKCVCTSNSINLTSILS